jgi:hypothetical protein
MVGASTISGPPGTSANIKISKDLDRFASNLYKTRTAAPFSGDVVLVTSSTVSLGGKGLMGTMTRVA